MSLKVHPKKIATIILVFIVFGSGLFVTHIRDTLGPTRVQLEKLYKTRFDSCFVTALEMRKYPSRGNYMVFKTDCSTEYFPLIGETIDSILFTNYPMVVKDSASRSLSLVKEGISYQWIMKNPEKEDDRSLGTAVILSFTIVLVIIVLVVPNSYFERKRFFDH